MPSLDVMLYVFLPSFLQALDSIYAKYTHTPQGGGSVITRSVVLDLEAREPHHKGKKVNLAARQEEANEELEDRSPEPRKKGKKGKKVKAAARQEEEANEELEIREPEHKAATAGKAAITITGTGATSLPAKPDGCATSKPLLLILFVV
jgi:hypothetical protein